MSPYRKLPEVERTPAEPAEDERYPDSDLWPVFIVFWLASVVCVVVALLRHETFGTEATLAALAIVLVPWLMLRADGDER